MNIFQFPPRPPPPPPPPSVNGSLNGTLGPPRGFLNLTTENYVIFYFSYTTYSTLLFTCIMLIVLCFILQVCAKLKPIRDKMLMPYFALLPVILVGIQRLITSNLNVQQLQDVACHFFIFAQWPVTIASLVGLSIYALKYIIIKKITVLRQKYQEQMIANTNTEDLTSETRSMPDDIEMDDNKDDMLDKDFENAMKNQQQDQNSSISAAAVAAVAVEVKKPEEDLVAPPTPVVTSPSSVVSPQSPIDQQLEQPLAASASDKNDTSMNEEIIVASTPVVPVVPVASNETPADQQENEMSAATGTTMTVKNYAAQQKLYSALQRLNSTPVLLLVVFAFLILFYVASIILYFALPTPDDSVQGRCENMRFIGKFLHDFGLLVAMVGLAVLLAFDMVTNLKDTVRCKWLTIFFYDDPLLYRLELVLILIIGTAYVIVCITLSSIYKGDFRRLNFAESITELIFEALIMLIIPGISIFASLYRTCQTSVLQYRFKKQLKDKQRQSVTLYSPTSDNIDYIIKHEGLNKAFKSFAKAEISLENVLFYEVCVCETKLFFLLTNFYMCKNSNLLQVVQQYKKLFERKRPQQRLLLKAQKIYDAYLSSAAIIDVNMPNSVKDHVKQQIKKCASEKTVVPSNLFEECETEVMKNLLDTYSRFFKSVQFKTALKKL